MGDTGTYYTASHPYVPFPWLTSQNNLNSSMSPLKLWFYPISPGFYLTFCMYPSSKGLLFLTSIALGFWPSIYTWNSLFLISPPIKIHPSRPHPIIISNSKCWSTMWSWPFHPVKKCCFLLKGFATWKLCKQGQCLTHFEFSIVQFLAHCHIEHYLSYLEAE